MRISLYAVLALAGLTGASVSRATIIKDLTTPGSSAIDASGAVFRQGDAASTGTGVIRSFVRIQTNHDIESGYNTDGRPLELDENNSAQFTHSLPLAELAIGKIADTDYRQFLLDINQLNNRPILSLSKLQIYQEDTADMTSYAAIAANGHKAYDMGDARVKLDYSLNSGSGSGDMLLSIPNALFVAGHPYLYLYSEFGRSIPGDQDAVTNNGGFEEWAAVMSAGSSTVPEPSAIALLLLISGAAISRRGRREPSGAFNDAGSRLG